MKKNEIKESHFEQEIMTDGIVVAKFYGSWCGPCKMADSVIYEIPEDKYGDIKIISLDVDKCPNLVRQFGIVSVPTFIFFKDGAELEKVVGFRNQNQLTELFDKYLNSEK